MCVSNEYHQPSEGDCAMTSSGVTLLLVTIFLLSKVEFCGRGQDASGLSVIFSGRDF